MTAPAGPRRSETFALVLIALLTLGELRLRERLLYANAVELEFVRVNAALILEGRPVSRSWQHRLLPAGAAAALTPVAGSHVAAVRWLENLLVAAANLLLYAIVRRRHPPRAGLLAVALLGFSHLLAMYKLEYPWDGIDVLLFLAFGACATAPRPTRIAPLLLIGALNHETVLYLPLFFLLAPLDPATRPPTWRRDAIGAAFAALAIGALTLVLRAWLYRGRPDLPGQVFEPLTPLIDNHLHVRHNLHQLFVEDWRAGRSFISASVLAAITAFAYLAARGPHRTAARWSLVVIATIICFGYVNETRHYLVLIAFWSAYLWSLAPVTRSAPAPPAAWSG